MKYLCHEKPPSWCIQQNLTIVPDTSILHMQYKINGHSRTSFNILKAKRAFAALNIQPCLSHRPACLTEEHPPQILSCLPFLAHRIYVLADMFNDKSHINLPWPLLCLVFRKWEVLQQDYTYTFKAKIFKAPKSKSRGMSRLSLETLCQWRAQFWADRASAHTANSRHNGYLTHRPWLSRISMSVLWNDSWEPIHHIY